MAVQLHVNGPASLILDGDVCGFSIDGFTLTFNLFQEDVFTDNYGPKMPYDTQIFLSDCVIKGQIINYDIDTLESWASGEPSGVDLGTAPAAGDLMVQNGHYGNLIIQSNPNDTGLTDVEHCWNFGVAFMVDAITGNFGTRRTAYDVTFRAILPQQTSSFGAVLFTTACT